MGYGYKKLLSEKDFLKVQMRAKALTKHGTSLYAIYYKDQTLYFKTRSATDDNIIYTQRIYLSKASIENILAAKTFRDVEKLIKDGDIKIHCTCPAFLYWGYKYMAWKRGYGLEKETRRPVIRNPYEKGYLCKHLYLVLQVFPYMQKALASKFRNWAVKKVESSDIRESNYLRKYGVKTHLGDSEDTKDTLTLEEANENLPEEKIEDTVNNNTATPTPDVESGADTGVPAEPLT